MIYVQTVIYFIKIEKLLSKIYILIYFETEDIAIIRLQKKKTEEKQLDRIKLVHMDTLSCEAIARRMPNGELLIVCQCGDIKEPAPQNRVYAFHSKDEGNTWSPKELIYPEDGQAVYSTEVMILDNEITVFLTLHNGYFVDWKCVMMKSFDNGYTWQNAGVTPHLNTYVFVRGMIKLSDGNILIPYQRYPISEEQNRVLREQNNYVWKADIKYVDSGVLLSKNGGKTYERFEGVHTPIREKWQWTEPTVVELSDKSLAMLLRYNGTGFLFRSNSFDGGKTWSEPEKTDIPNPDNKVKLLKFNDGRIALLHTPNGNFGLRLRGRNPLSVWISNDDMKSWYYKHEIAAFDGCYSYPDGFITEDSKHIMFAFEFNRHDIYFVDHEIAE